MSLPDGTRLGSYEITHRIGAGGMGEVYRATDTKLGRDVAIKILPAELADDAHRLARFEREAKLLAALNHAHIGAIYGLDEHEGTRYIVMELIEGSTLEETLKSGRLRGEDALRLALQIAEALEAAHNKGVVHRDLKPANIMVTPDGVVKVLDFGLAKAFAKDPDDASPAHSPALSVAMAQAGLVLGTAAYMSPEQASGQGTDQRADIWAFGVVLYEMLTGLPLFSGESVPHVLADVLRSDPNWDRLPKRLHPRVRLLLQRCLEKSVRSRYHSIADVRVDIEKALSDPEGAATEAVIAKPVWRYALPLAGAAAFVAAAVVWFATDANRNVPSEVVRQVIRFTVPVGEGQQDGDADGAEILLGGVLETGFGRPSSVSLALSNDGNRLVYSGWQMAPDESVQSRLYLRRLDQERAGPMAGTDGGSSPFFSPDDAWVGFFEQSSLRRLSLASSDVETIVADVELGQAGPSGASWGDDGTIVYAATDGLYRVAASGGEPELIAAPDPESGEFDRYAQPEVLPGSNLLLFHGIVPSQDPEQAAILAIDLATRAQTTLLHDAMDPRYVTASGQLLFARRGSLMAVGFDADTVALVGTPVVVEESVMQAVGTPNSAWETGAAQLAISASGHIAYASGGVYPEESKQMMRVTLEGEAEPLALEPRSYGTIRATAEGDRLVFAIRSGRSANIHLHDLNRGITQQLDTRSATASWPIWSPDGSEVLYATNREGGLLNIYRIAADGSGEPVRLAPADRNQIPTSWSSTGVIAYLQGDEARRSYDIWVLPPEGEPEALVVSDVDERYPSFSPDGQWLTYTSGPGVYVRPYPGPGPATLIANRGFSPAWAADSSQIYYLVTAEDDRYVMMVVDVAIGDSFQASRPRSLIDPWPYDAATPGRIYDVLADGTFLTSIPEALLEAGAERLSLEQRARRTTAVSEFHVVYNFVEELRRRTGN